MMKSQGSNPRVFGLQAAERRFGARAHEIASWFEVGDPSWTLDPSPQRVIAPKWLDLERCNRGGLALRRHGVLASAVLRAYALPLSYLSPVGIMPLLFSGELLNNAAPRLYRTANYVVETHQENAMHPDGAAWTTAATIRTIHQRIRKGLLANHWPHNLGCPIPQTDVAVTALLFGPLTVAGMKKLGARISPQEADDVAHLSRAMAFGQGVVEELQADTHARALMLYEELTCLNGNADDNGRALMESLLDIPINIANTPIERRLAPLTRGFYRSLSAHLLGTEQAQALGVLGRKRWILGLRLILKTAPLFHPRFSPLHERLVRRILDEGNLRIQTMSDPS